MTTIWLLLWTLAVFLVVANPKNESNWWASIFTFSCGLGGLKTVWYDEYYPLIINNSNIHAYLGLHSIACWFVIYIAPYSYVMFALSQSGEFELHSQRWRRLSYIFWLMPLIIEAFIYPPHTFFIQSKAAPYFWQMKMWIIPLELYASYLLIKGYLRETNKKKKRQNLLSCIFMVPTTAYAVTVHYILFLFGESNAWRDTELVVVIIAFGAFLFVAKKSGMMGLKLQFEQENTRDFIDSANSGSLILVHTLKNEIAKISYSLENIKYDPNDKDNYMVAQRSLDHLKVMAARIREVLSDFELNEEACNLAEILTDSIKTHVAVVKQKNIKIIKNVVNAYVVCDKMHMTDVFNNIIINAIDAIGNNGVIEINVNKSSKWVSVSVKDTGCGIPKEKIKHIFEPYFTTKKVKNNFGLGLCQCFNVIERHGGKIAVESEVGVGTVFIVELKLDNKIKAVKKNKDGEISCH